MFRRVAVADHHSPVARADAKRVAVTQAMEARWNGWHQALVGIAALGDASQPGAAEAVLAEEIDHGADVTMRSDLEGQTPLQAAQQMGLTGVADRLRVMGAEDPPGPVPVHERAPMGNWLGRLRRGRRG